MDKRVIVTGGAGYIGSHILVELLTAGWDALVIDDFSNSSPIALDRVAAITGRRPEFLKADLADAAQSPSVFGAVAAFKPAGAIHLAGLKAVGESVSDPVRYYGVNIGSAVTLIRAMEAAGARAIVFSSSATVYGDLNQSPVSEAGATGPTNPYGKSKFFIEEMLRDLASADPRWQIANLRYFNPVGAHPSGEIGEDPNGVPNNLFPYIAQVAVGRLPKLKIFGGDYPTPDGTGVRDYIHVVDLARGHLAALEFLASKKSAGAVDINLGTGLGVSVLQAVAAFKRASNRDIPYEVAARRPGDVATVYADAAKAKALLGWRATKTIKEMCADHWRWQSANPEGYR
ncbi:MAG: UDP-glucose 4-epimerase GalE [Parvularculaceae bacterium]|nr:UDP-glucose 4-epimerase GalE [Parvularculaceae bacterium]